MHRLLTTWKVPDDLDVLDPETVPPKRSPTGADVLDKMDLAAFGEAAMNTEVNEESEVAGTPRRITKEELSEWHKNNFRRHFPYVNEDGTWDRENLPEDVKDFVLGRLESMEATKYEDKAKELAAAESEEQYNEMMAAKELYDKNQALEAA